MADRADRDANRALRARFDDVFGQYQRLRSGMDDIQRTLADLRITAESPDGLVRATVGARGQLVDLTIDRRAYAEVDPDRLGRIVVATVQQAGERTTERVRELMSAYLPPDSGALEFVRDRDFGALLRRPDEIMRNAAGDRDE